MRFLSKIQFSYFLFSITFNENFKDLILIFCIGVLNTTLEGTTERKKIQF